MAHQTLDDIVNLLQLLVQSNVCKGNPDQKFLELLNDQKGVFKNKSGKFLLLCNNNIYILQGML